MLKVTKNSSRRKIILTILVIVLLVAGTIGVMAIQNIGPFAKDSADTIHDTNPSEDTTPGTSDEAEEDRDENSRQDGEDSVEANGGSQQSLQKPVISTLEQTGDTVMVRAIMGSGITSGTCTLTFTRGSHTVTESAPIGMVTSYYTCQGFNVPVSKFAAKGAWSVSVLITSGSRSATSDTGSITIQ